jgi:hypothetical protein
MDEVTGPNEASVSSIRQNGMKSVTKHESKVPSSGMDIFVVQALVLTGWHLQEMAQMTR